MAGCLLPFLIILNLFFGRIFFSASHWIAIELILILLFTFNVMVMTRKMFSSLGERKNGQRKNVIDVEGEIIEDKEETKCRE